MKAIDERLGVFQIRKAHKLASHFPTPILAVFAASTLIRAKGGGDALRLSHLLGVEAPSEQGTVGLELLPHDFGVWHAGRSTAKSIKENNRNSMNN